MPRTEAYQLRLSKSEKDELAQRAKLQGVSIAKLIRQKLGLDASAAETDLPADYVPEYIEVPPIPDEGKFKVLVAQHKRFMSTRKAEAKARRELS